MRIQCIFRYFSLFFISDLFTPLMKLDVCMNSNTFYLFCRLFFAREASDDEWGKLQEWKMEFLYFETWRSEACSLEQTIYMFLNRDLFCCVWMCFKILLDCSFCTSIRIMILCTRHRD